MSILLTKASHNYRVAQNLVNSGGYSAPSVHCSYYACLQTIIHILSLMGVSQEEIDAKTDGRGSHENLIACIVGYIRHDPASVKSFTSKIRDLKKYRKESDYENKIVEPERAKLAFEISLELKGFFRNNFNVIVP